MAAQHQPGASPSLAATVHHGSNGLEQRPVDQFALDRERTCTARHSLKPLRGAGFWRHFLDVPLHPVSSRFSPEGMRDIDGLAERLNKSARLARTSQNCPCYIDPDLENRPF